MRWLNRWRRTGRLAYAARGPARAGSLPQILVDISVIYRHDARTGIQRVVRGILMQLIEHGAPGHIVRAVFATRDHGYHYASLEFLSDSSSTASWRDQPTSAVQVGPDDIFLGLDLAAHLLPRHRAEVAQWKAAGVSIRLMVHDLLPVRHSRWFQRKTVRNFRRWLKFLADFCDVAICVSRDTEQDLRSWLARYRPKRLEAIQTHVIRLGGDIGSTAPSRGVSGEAQEALQRHSLRPFVLIVGTVEPRKGLNAAIDAFELLWAHQGDAAPDLVIVGRPGWKTDRLQRRIQRHRDSGRRLYWFNDASDELLDLLYRGCQGVVAPSYAEGFGLPVEEAGRYGKAVLARDIPVFREPGRQVASFFRNDAEFAGELERWVAVTRDRVAPPPASESRGWEATRLDLLGALGIDTAAAAHREPPPLASIASA